MGEPTLTPKECVLVDNPDVCPYSKEQIDICRKHSLPIMGAIMCNTAAHRDTTTCKTVPEFPAFCNVVTKTCVTGLRQSKEDFEALETRK